MSLLFLVRFALPIVIIATLTFGAVNRSVACVLAAEEFVFAADPTRPFFPDPTKLNCTELANGTVVNLPLRETDGDLIYAIGNAPLSKINAYLLSRGSKIKAKPNADDPTQGTIRIAYYDMKTSAGPFHSLAVTIVTESEDLPAAFHYALYYAHEDFNEKYGKLLIGIDKIRTPVVSNLRQVLTEQPVGRGGISVSVGDTEKVFNLYVEPPNALQFKTVNHLSYRTFTEGAVGGAGPQAIVGKIRGDFSAPFKAGDVQYMISTNGKLADLLVTLGYQLSSFQIVKNFDLVEGEF